MCFCLLTLQCVGRGAAYQPKLDSGSDGSDLLSTSHSESSDEDMASGEEEDGSLEGKTADVEMATTSGTVSCDFSVTTSHNTLAC